MSHPVLATILVLWVALCAWAAHRIGDLFTDTNIRAELRAVVFIALLPLIVADELIAKPQFDAVCSEKAVLQVYASKVSGRLVRSNRLPPEPIPGVSVPVVMEKQLYIDEGTRQTVLSFTTLHAGGGKLARALGEPEPLTFHGACAPRNRDGALSMLGIHELSASPAEEGDRR